MQDDLDENQRMLAEAVERYLSRAYDFQARQQSLAATQGHSPAHWAAFAELGLLGLTVPEDCGGMGLDATSTHVVMEAFGRHLVTEAYASTAVLCVQLLAHGARGAQRSQLLADLATGACILAFAQGEPQTDYTLHNVQTQATASADGWRLSGRKTMVLQGPVANQLLVSARTSGPALSTDGISLFLVDPQSAGVQRVDYTAIDGMPCADFAFDGVQLAPQALVGVQDAAYPTILHASDIATAALCAQSVGAMAAIVDATLAYVKVRQQFRSPIGSFQAVQHRLVDMSLALEQARSLAWLAAQQVDAADAVARQRIVSAAKAKCGESARFIAQQGIQLHGGIGMTDELPLGHHVKRLIAIEHTLGDARHHLARYARLADPAHIA
ncbi:acyl-CoA dehydrogenase family protein [Pantoea sp. 18069]|uniref:acyl-CoA dehydrogenase family protein n=1 Tax=Pantoea sp. 18069 TaxID=2681415 RepID=UPI0013569CBA|nr:acyl-CoA dehydrogenase family protein [Pantoea sp. 18069]